MTLRGDRCRPKAWPAWLQGLQQGVRATRQHHALEHATLQLLAARGALSEGGGLSDPGGFVLVGDMSLAATETAVQDALAALQAGAAALALHPQCGSNLSAQAALCLGVGWLCFGPRQKLTLPRLTVALCGFMVAIVLGDRYLGPGVQRYTTLADVADRDIKAVFPISVLGRRCLRVAIGSRA